MSPQTEVFLVLLGPQRTSRIASVRKQRLWECPSVFPTHLTVYCFVLDCCLAVSLSSCLSQMTSLFRWYRRIPSAFPSASSAQGPGWRQVLPPQVFGNHTCAGGSQAAGTRGRAHGQWRPQGLGWLPLAPFSPECGS